MLAIGWRVINSWYKSKSYTFQNKLFCLCNTKYMQNNCIKIGIYEYLLRNIPVFCQYFSRNSVPSWTIQNIFGNLEA